MTRLVHYFDPERALADLGLPLEDSPLLVVVLHPCQVDLISA